nr:hypothetical protein [Providencia rettgeri]
MLESKLFRKLISAMLVLAYKYPIATKLIAILFTTLFIISSVKFIESGFNSLMDGVLTILLAIAMIKSLLFALDKTTIANHHLTHYFIENQDAIASDEEIAFFLREAEAEGFKTELMDYINKLGRKPLIKECLSKCLDLKHDKNDGNIDAWKR